MEDTTKNYTEVAALNAAIAYIPESEVELIAKLGKMVETRSKKRERKTDDSKRLANIALGEQFMAIWPADQEFGAADVREALNLGTAAKASQVCKAMGWSEIPSTKRTKVYKF